MKHQNYICLNGKKITIPAEKLREIKQALEEDAKGKPSVFLEERENGETIAHVGEYEFLVLEKSGDTIAVVLKDLLFESMAFGSDNNDFRKSKVLPVLREFAEKIENIVGEENLVEHTVDLTSEDGLKDYGTIKEKMSLLTTDLYRRYVDVLDIDRLTKWYWLATPHSTARHENSAWVNCVSPRGNICNGNCNGGNSGVRPFCILKSDIFVS